jgi:membrane protease YdiL (CAAX protease family)
VDTPTDSRAAFIEPSIGEFVPDPATLAPAPPDPQAIDPDRPAWGILAAIGVTISLFLFQGIVQIVFLIPYVLTFRTSDPETLKKLLTGDRAILLSIIAIIPAHLLTLALAWAVVTGFRKRPFWRSLGWTWSPRFGALELFVCLGATLLLLGAGQLLSVVFGDPETELERMILSSPAARYFIAALATFTAPLVEEVVFRGVLYAGLRRWFTKFLAIVRHVRYNFTEVKQAWRTESLYGGNEFEEAGKASTVLGAVVVIIIFAAIHVPQYWPNVAAISTILLLSSVLTVVRARTGRLLPCFVIHLFFNGITSVIIVLSPFLQHATPPPSPSPTTPTTPTGALFFLIDHAARLFS